MMLALSLLPVLAPSRVDAQTPASSASASTPSTAQQSDELFVKGKGLLKEGKKQEALAAYREAWKLRKSYDVAGNLGSLEVELGLYRDAAEHLSYALSHYAASGTTKDQLDKARQRLETARKEVGALRITVNIAGAEVLVDGVSIGRAPVSDEVFVAAGSHQVEARLAGHVPAALSVEAKKGKAEDVQLGLVPQPAATASASATTTTAPVPPPPPSPAPAYVMGGVAIASLIAGGVLVGVANGSEADIKAKSNAIAAGGAGCPADPRCADLESAARGGDTMSRAGIGLLIGGAVVGAAAGVYLLWASGRSRQSAFHVVPVGSHQGGGVIAVGKF